MRSDRLFSVEPNTSPRLRVENPICKNYRTRWTSDTYLIKLTAKVIKHVVSIDDKIGPCDSPMITSASSIADGRYLFFFRAVVTARPRDIFAMLMYPPSFFSWGYRPLPPVPLCLQHDEGCSYFLTVTALTRPTCLDSILRVPAFMHERLACQRVLEGL